MTASVVAEDVRRTYGDAVALDGVSLSVERGEVFALIGPNGAGKTTLVRALTGTTVPDGGSVSLLGAPPADVPAERLGVLPQSFSPPERLTARELLDYYAGLYDDPRDVDAVLADVGLADDADTWYENCSGGQQRRVCLGAAVVNDPDVLFLDEPTTAIDPAGRRAVWDLVESLAAGGTTVVLTTHDMAEAERLGDRVGLLVDGSLAVTGTPETLVREFGGAARLVVRTDADPDLDRATERFGDDLHVYDVAPEAISSVVAALDDRGVDYEELTWRQPSLEDVYLELTGESYAVDADPDAVDGEGANQAAATPAANGGDRA